MAVRTPPGKTQGGQAGWPCLGGEAKSVGCLHMRGLFRQGTSMSPVDLWWAQGSHSGGGASGHAQQGHRCEQANFGRGEMRRIFRPQGTQERGTSAGIESRGRELQEDDGDGAGEKHLEEFKKTHRERLNLQHLQKLHGASSQQPQCRNNFPIPLPVLAPVQSQRGGPAALSVILTGHSCFKN